MKGTLKTISQDGQIKVKPFSIPLMKTKPRLDLKMLTPENEEPIAVYYFESGWNHGYPTYHVIIENGDFEQTDNLFLSRQEFINKFGIDPIDEDSKDPNQAEYNF